MLSNRTAARVPLALLLIALVLCFPPAEAQDGGTAADTPWRSALYPESWTPSHTGDDGRFLQDFSWAGYRHGETPPVIREGIVRVEMPDGAQPDGSTDVTAAIRAAIDKVQQAGKGVVLIPRGTWRIDGRLQVTASHVVIRGEGPEHTRLLFTKDSGLNSSAHLLIAGTVTRSGNWALAADADVRDTSVTLASVDGLAVGDHIAIGQTISDEFRADHGMTGLWEFAAGKWRALFRRVIRRIDSGRKVVHFRVPLRYPLLTKYGASVKKEAGYLVECGIEDLAVCNAVDPDAAWKQTRTHAIELTGVENAWVRNVRSFECPRTDIEHGGDHLMSGGIRVTNSRCVTVTDCSMAMAQHRGGGGNGYLFEILQCNEVLTVNCQARRGRHNFIQNWDFGTSGCVWLRCVSRDGVALFVRQPPVGIVGTSEYHHSLAMGCLVDSCEIDDGWKAVSRGRESSGAGHCATQCVFWNSRGRGSIQSAQYGMGYVIGTDPRMRVTTSTRARYASGTEPEDHTEGIGRAATLQPQSLYDDQRRRRLGRERSE